MFTHLNLPYPRLYTHTPVALSLFSIVSNRLSFAFPLLLFPLTIILMITLSASDSSLLTTYPKHLSPLSSLSCRPLSKLHQYNLTCYRFLFYLLSALHCRGESSKHSHFHNTRTLFYSPVSCPTLRTISTRYLDLENLSLNSHRLLIALFWIIHFTKLIEI